MPELRFTARDYPEGKANRELVRSALFLGYLIGGPKDGDEYRS
jgi:hypothetical protein